MAWPMVAMRLLVAITNFYAMWMLSTIGPLELAAGAIIFVMQTSVTMVMASILYSISPIVSRAFGAKDHTKVGAIAQQGWLLSIFLSAGCNPSLVFTQYFTKVRSEPSNCSDRG